MSNRASSVMNDPIAMMGVPDVEPEAWPVVEFRAMGSQMSVRLALSAAAAAVPLQRAIDYFARAEAQLSRFISQSELSEVNENAGTWRTLSPLLWNVLTVALEMAAATGGIFDPTLLGALRASGYDRDFAEIVGQASSAALSTFAGQREDAGGGGQWRRIGRRPATHEILLPTGMAIDLGGIAKGVIAEQVVEMLRAYGPCLVDAGGDVVAGAAPPGWPGWPVAIAAPSGVGNGEMAEDLAVLWLCEATLATSGVDYRRWQHHGQWAHHIIDPRRGRPAATDLVSVTVLARQAAPAEAWAKSALIVGAEAGYAALTAQEFGALLVDQSGRVVMTPALERYIACA